MGNTKVQLVGNYYVDAVANSLQKEGFIIQNVLSGISPFTLCCSSDKRMIEEWEPKIRDLNQWNENPSAKLYEKQTRTLFDLKKNFNQMLSSNKNEYCDNVVFYGPGKEIFYSNESEYIIVDNSAFIYNLFKFNNIYYTIGYPVSPFINHLSKQFGVEKICPSLEDDFNWKFYYDKYINTILENYKSSKIILIKTPYSEFFNNKGNLSFFQSDKKRGRFITELDNYFAQNTGCIVIDTLCGKIPNEEVHMSWPFGAAMETFADEIAAEITRLIKLVPENAQCSFAQCVSHIAQTINLRLKDDQCIYMVDYAEKKRIVSWKQMLQSPYSHVFEPFNSFLIKDETLFDYIKPFINDVTDIETLKSEVDIDLIEGYTSIFKCSLNDILAIYKLYELWEDKTIFKNIAMNICGDAQNAAVKACNELISSNIKVLREFEYIDHHILNDIPKTQKKYLHICTNGYMVIDPLSDEPFKLDYEVKKNDIDITQIIENGCICTIQYADTLTYNCNYYIEKTRKGMGKMPTYLKFDTAAEFFDSILYENYKALLENENFVFEIGSLKYPELSVYEPVTDITALLEPDTAVVKVTWGLGNQVCFYVLGELLGELGNKKIVYDDISPFPFISAKIDDLAKKEMKLLSKMVSKRIFYNLLTKGVFDILYSRLNEDAVFVSRDWNLYKQSSFYFRNDLIIPRNIKQLPKRLPAHSYIFLFLKLEDTINALQLKNFTLKDYIHFSAFDSKENMELGQSIQSCDSVILNIRRGDFISFGWETDTSYYSESVAKIMKLPQYKNKKFFVFSDDIPWCEEHKSELGLDIVGDCEVIYVEGNKGIDNYRDIQLMALGKIMILSDSTFSCVAALYSDSWEVMLCPNTSRFNVIQNYVRKNKYDIGNVDSKYNRIYTYAPKSFTTPPKK